MDPPLSRLSPLSSFVEIEAGQTIWRFERSFLSSNWACIWGRGQGEGCLGILPTEAEHLGQGCCSFGADLDGEDEARTVAASAAGLEPEVFEHHSEAAAGGVLADGSGGGLATRVVDGACIFLNRPRFAGGAGCALHLAALAAGESPIDWKPSVCWQLPIKVEWSAGVEAEGEVEVEVATVRGWTRPDWGAEGVAMAWCCTEGNRAYVGDRPVVESLGEELQAVVGEEVYVELRRRLQ